MLKEFKDFINRGNVVDMAVGIIIGAAFTTIVNSLVNDMIMPVAGMVTGGMDFSDFYMSLNGEKYATLADAKAAGAPTLNYGVFINAVINFLIVAFAVFILVKNVNRLRKEEKAAVPAAPPADVVLLTEIRDLLKK